MEENIINDTNIPFDMEGYFCPLCLFMFKNCNAVSLQGDVGDMINTDLYKDSKKMDCKFCFGILGTEGYPYIVDKIKEEIENYDHEDVKITTNFSPLFGLVHTYVRDIYNV